MPSQSASTAVLIEAVLRGTKDAWDLLDERFRWRLALLARGKIPEGMRGRVATEDIVQGALASAYVELERFHVDGGMSFLRWTSTILRNQLIDEIRFHQSQARDHRASLPGVVLEERPDESSTGEAPDDVVELAETLARLLEAVGDLPADQRRAVELRFMESKTYESIGGGLGVSEAQARRNVARAIIRLRERLE